MSDFLDIDLDIDIDTKWNQLKTALGKLGQWFDKQYNDVKNAENKFEKWVGDPIKVKYAGDKLEAVAGQIEQLNKNLDKQGGIIKQLEGIMKQLEGIMKHLFPKGDIIPNLFKEINGTINSVASIASGLILQVGGVTLAVGTALNVIDGVKKNILVNKIDKKYKENLNLTFDKLNQARAKAIEDLRELIGEIDTVLENRINQIALIAGQYLIEFLQFAQQFTPNSYMKNLVEPTFEKLNEFESKIFNDLDQRLDKIFAHLEIFRERVDEMFIGSLEEFRNEIRRRRNFFDLPNPLDKCRQSLNIAHKFGKDLTDIEIYRLMECHALSELNETTPLQRIIETYAQLQLNAIRMASVARKAPALRKQAIKDWVKYGMLCEFWENIGNKYHVSSV